MKASHSLSYQQQWCNFSIWTTLQSSKLCQLWSFDFMLCHVKKSFRNAFFLFGKPSFLFFLKMYVKMTQLRTKVLICPNWNSIFKIWDILWAKASWNTMQQKLFQNHLSLNFRREFWLRVIKTLPKNNNFFKKIF